MSPFKWPREVIQMIKPRKIIRFSAKCREKNRIYEQNNNAELDNGVYNEFVNEQEREEGLMMAQNSLADSKSNEDDDDGDEEIDDMELDVDVEEFKGNVSGTSLARPSQRKK